MNFIYPATIKKDKGSFLVTFRDISFAATEGDSVKDAWGQAQDCLETAIASCIKDKEKIPLPSEIQKGEYPVTLPAQTAAKTALYIAIKKTGLSNSDLAKQLEIDEKEIRRMLDPWHQTKLPRIELVLNALGFHLSVSMESAA